MMRMMSFCLFTSHALSAQAHSKALVHALALALVKALIHALGGWAFMLRSSRG